MLQPTTGLLDPEDKNKRDPPVPGKDKKDKLQSRQNTARDHRPAHEKPANFPPGLKRPDPTSTVDGRKISNDAQRQLFDDINDLGGMFTQNQYSIISYYTIITLS